MTVDQTDSPVPEPGLNAMAPGTSDEIYGMPAFITFAVRDVLAIRDWYVEGLGFIDLFSFPGPDGSPALVHLRRWKFQDILIRPAAQPPVPGTAATLSIAAVYGELDGLAERARQHGGGTVDGPDDTPWNTRDLTTRDPDGNTVIFTAPRPPEQVDAAFSASMLELHEQQNG